MVTRLTGGLTPGDGADPRTFPAIWNATAETIESQGSAITSNDSDITALQGSAVALGSAVDNLTTDVQTIQGWNLQDLNNVSFASAVADGQALVYSTAIPGWTNGAGGGGGGASVSIGTAAPGSPSDGDMWWNSTDGNLYIYYTDADSSQWVASNGPQVLVSEVAPNGYQGQLWFDSTQGKVFIYYDDGTSGQFVSAIGGSLAGSVLQVVSTNYTNTFTSSSTTPADVTGFSATITPRSTSSKILILFNAWTGYSASDTYPYYLLKRGATQIGNGISATGVQINTFASTPALPGAASGVGTYKLLNASRSYLDSPGTTSATTYQVQFASGYTGTAYINRQHDQTNQPYIQYPSSDLILMEIAG